jgi:hypothetical protein
MATQGEIFNPEELERQLDRLLEAYRRACPDPEPTAAFLPGVWRLIERRRDSTYSLCRWAQALVGAAAAVCVLLGILLNASTPGPVFNRTTYIEALAEENSAELQLYASAFSGENGSR